MIDNMNGDSPRVTKRPRRVPRASQACNWCRTRKTKCDQLRPCSYCAYHSLDCVYKTSANESIPSTAKRPTQIGEVQRSSGTRSSPWPEGTGTQGLRNHPQRDPSQTPTRRASRRTNSPDETSVQPCTPVADLTSIIDGRKPDADTVRTPEVADSSSRDGLSGVNIHTNGTEFYGNSSNLAFLGNLYSRARSHAQDRTSKDLVGGNFVSPANSTRIDHATNQFSPAVNKESENESPRHDRAQLSIVNLLYNPSYPVQSNHAQARPGNGRDKERRHSRAEPGETASHSRSDKRHGMASVIDKLSDEAQLEIERMFISSYFTNKHYIHPMLDKSGFMRRCESEAWTIPKRARFVRGSSKFAGLYFAVVAMGAMNASPNETALLDHYCTYSPDLKKSGSAGEYSALDFAHYYFGIAKKALGDIFESCSLESAQALLVLSVYCQNALRPHSCFMYSGMAVRTAVAIGLASGLSSLSASIRKEGQRTWWCIYSHEIEMCCSSGRLDSMKDLHHYQVPLPKLHATPGNDSDPDAEENDVAMIPVMVALARIMSEASHLIYHDTTKRSMAEMSQIAMSLDKKLLDWKAHLPGFLDIDAASLNDTEWAFKQKLVLRLRFYNTRILIHRPFLAASTANNSNSHSLLHHHLQICLDASRASIQMQYESFMHRIYIRTWWYNTTYALYASMILLHLILSDFPGLFLSADELLADVDKSLDIFASMNNVLVARRCAEMIKEVREVARSCVARRRAFFNPPVHHPAFPTTPALPTDPGSHANNNHDNRVTDDESHGDFFSSLFSLDAQHGFGDADINTTARAEILANLVDPTVLEDFAFGDACSTNLSLFYSP